MHSYEDVRVKKIIASLFNQKEPQNDDLSNMRGLPLRFFTSVESPQNEQPSHTLRPTLKESGFQSPPEPPEPPDPDVEERIKAMQGSRELAEYERRKKAALSSR